MERNKIWVAMTLKNFGAKAKDFGGWLFNSGVMGARVVGENTQAKNINTSKFLNFGGHCEGFEYEGFPYLVAAAAIGVSKNEIKRFLEILEKNYFKFLKKINK